ncbi:MAG: Gfo/Idh/MocA family protein [Devosia sp.]
MTRRKIAVIGVGKIALDQHLPVIEKGEDFQLAALVSQRGVGHGGVPVFSTPAELYAAMPEIGLVAICTPPGVRHELALEAINAGKDVLLEKPPATTISEFDDLCQKAMRKGRLLFQTWHSRENAAVDRARDLLAAEGVARLRIDWRESVRKWHPGQDWVWEPGGFGVFDPGINALSILTQILPFPVFVEGAVLRYPENRQTPVDVEIAFRTGEPHRPEISAHFNWLETEGEIWTISIETSAGRRLALEKGGTVLRIDGEVALEAPSEEYERIYDRFADRLDAGQSETDDRPLRLVADAMMLGRRETVAAFDW